MSFVIAGRVLVNTYNERVDHLHSRQTSAQKGLALVRERSGGVTVPSSRSEHGISPAATRTNASPF
jgi:hypothetical protein